MAGLGLGMFVPVCCLVLQVEFGAWLQGSALDERTPGAPVVEGCVGGECGGLWWGGGLWPGGVSLWSCCGVGLGGPLCGPPGSR